MVMQNSLDLSSAVDYHYEGFPPEKIDASRILSSLASASAALARYDQMLKGLHNSEILLAPLQRQEAVVSSRMEGTVSTLDEVLKYEADQEEGGDGATIHSRSEAIEVFLYARALKLAHSSLKDGHPLSSHLFRDAHRVLLSFGRGAASSPGHFKTEQNYLADRSRRRVLFIPIKPEFLNDGMERLFSYVNGENDQILIKTAVSHLEFEALHPFQDGNGRVGRMFVTLLLWRYGAISEPHFYISQFFEENKDEYIDKMREVSNTRNWTDWIDFFLNAIESQANKNLEIAERIRSLYEDMRRELPETLASKWNAIALDFIFERPVFRNNVFTKRSGMPEASAHRLTRTLVEKGILQTIEPASGRKAALYRFEPLMQLIRQ